MKIAIGADHGGFKLKQALVKFLKNKGHSIKDFGTFSTDSCDYPVIGIRGSDDNLTDGRILGPWTITVLEMIVFQMG